jgi:hypothetical protein
MLHWSPMRHPWDDTEMYRTIIGTLYGCSICGEYDKNIGILIYLDGRPMCVTDSLYVDDEHDLKEVCGHCSDCIDMGCGRRDSNMYILKTDCEDPVTFYQNYAIPPLVESIRYIEFCQVAEIVMYARFLINGLEEQTVRIRPDCIIEEIPTPLPKDLNNIIIHYYSPETVFYQSIMSKY